MDVLRKPAGGCAGPARRKRNSARRMSCNSGHLCAADWLKRRIPVNQTVVTSARKFPSVPTLEEPYFVVFVIVAAETSMAATTKRAAKDMPTQLLAD